MAIRKLNYHCNRDNRDTSAVLRLFPQIKQNLAVFRARFFRIYVRNESYSSGNAAMSAGACAVKTTIDEQAPFDTARSDRPALQFSSSIVPSYRLAEYSTFPAIQQHLSSCSNNSAATAQQQFSSYSTAAIQQLHLSTLWLGCVIE